MAEPALSQPLLENNEDMDEETELGGEPVEGELPPSSSGPGAEPEAEPLLAAPPDEDGVPSGGGLLARLNSFSTTTKVVVAVMLAVLALGLGIGLSRRGGKSKTSFCSYTGYRLPHNAFVPTAYTVTLTPSFALPAANYSGSVIVDVTIGSEDADCILIHAASDFVYSAVTTDGHSAEHSVDAANERLVVRAGDKRFRKNSVVQLSLRCDGSRALRVRGD